MRRALIILAWPLIEIGLFVVIGGEIGLWPTLAWVLLTAVAGVLLLKFTAARGMMLLRGGMDPAALRDGAPVTGLLRGLAALLLILPGFLTDTLGLVLLLLTAVPPLRQKLQASVMRRVVPAGAAGMGFGTAFGQGPGPRSPQGGDDILDGEWVEVPPEANRNRPSRWTEIE
ncbi:FxsA family protein [Pseudogemmobacter faecipullorum]|uniref:FxsA family protein n=1 Tax=Pseudogemmobacter faecipullorum TaxID=2755041 RepID=A0ABS8CH88_9RHOB|nr:FxsA family protein [Pseudogemmobacter faecipullorum]MCB5408756.1 FxsA family protein [Pseudogemmobacter faecipullorum]